MRTVLAFGAVCALGVLGDAQTVDLSPLRLTGTPPVPGRTFQATLTYPPGPGRRYALAFDAERLRPPLRLPGVGELGLRGSAAFLVLAVGALDGSGRARFSLALPPDPGLVGLRFYLQALVLDTNRPAGAVLSNLFVGRIVKGRTFTTADGTLAAGRAFHTATLLQDGRVLVVGGGRGSIGNPVLSTLAELYHPWTQRFRPTASPPLTPRALHTATLLQDGRVLIAGGANARTALKAASLYDPRQDRFTALPGLTTPRAGHTATLLPDGRVLLCGGVTGRNTYPSLFATVTATTEIFDPRTGTFSPGPRMSLPRMGHVALPYRIGGKDYVLLAGGVVGLAFGLVPVYTWTAEAYDVAAGAFTRSPGGRRLGVLPLPVTAAGGCVLPDGRLFLAGGVTGALPQATGVTALFDPVRNLFTRGPSLPRARAAPPLALLPGGGVLVAGGATGTAFAPQATATAYLFTQGVFTALPNLHVPRGAHTATTLPNGTVVLIGGGRDGRTAVATAEYFVP